MTEAQGRKELREAREKWLGDDWKAACTPMPERDAFDDGFEAGQLSGIRIGLEAVRKLSNEVVVEVGGKFAETPMLNRALLKFMTRLRSLSPEEIQKEQCQ